MAILVTSGAGYTGSHCVAVLIGRGADVAVVDDLFKGHQEVLKGGHLHVSSMADRAFLDDVFSREPIEAVIHFVTSSLVGGSVQMPEQYFYNNITAGLTLIETMLAHRMSYLVFSSTAAVLGEPECVPIDETHPQNPTNPYNGSKFTVGKMSKWYDLVHNLKFCVLRYFNAVGAWHDGSISEDHRPESHPIPFILQAAQGKRGQLSLFDTGYPTKGGTCIRGYIHVEDLIGVHFPTLDHLKRINTSAAFSLDDGQGFSNRKIIEAARRVTGHPILVRGEGRRPGGPATLTASSRKAMEVLGW